MYTDIQIYRYTDTYIHIYSYRYMCAERELKVGRALVLELEPLAGVHLRGYTYLSGYIDE